VFRFKFQLVFFFVIVLHVDTEAQDLCTGNLGENVFADGDFGSGSDQILLEDPEIATGFIYERNPPPFDGEYTITNNSDWPNKYGTWLGIGDNSSDPDGYMMVVNADFTPGTFFEQVVSGLCENTTYVFSADIINMIQRGVTDHSDPDVSFLLNDEVFFNTGLISKSEEWNTYGFTFTAGVGETDLVLTLRNNAPGGRGNDLALDNISFRACGPDASIVAPSSRIVLCPDSAPIDLATDVSDTDFSFVQWQRSLDQGNTWNDIAGANDQLFSHEAFDIGQYSYRYYAAQSSTNLSNTLCRIVSDTTVVEILPIEFSVIDTICEGAVFDLGPRQISETGVYTAQLVGRMGCDSIVTLDLTVINDRELELVTDVAGPACFGFSDGRITVTDVVNGIPPFIYIFGGDTIGSREYNDLPAGDYTIAVVDRFMCADDLVVSIEAPDELFVDLGDDIDVLLGEAVTLVPRVSEQLSSFIWNPLPDDPSCPGCREPSFTPFDNIQLQLSVTNADGCEATDDISVRVDKDYSVYIPNGFSPNADGTNETFTMYAREGLIEEVEDFMILDRWGNILYETQDLQINDPTSGWDGRYGDQRVSSGPYTYSARIRFIDQRVETLSGAIMIID